MYHLLTPSFGLAGVSSSVPLLGALPLTRDGVRTCCSCRAHSAWSSSASSWLLEGPFALSAGLFYMAISLSILGECAGLADETSSRIVYSSGSVFGFIGSVFGRTCSNFLVDVTYFCLSINSRSSIPNSAGPVLSTILHRSYVSITHVPLVTQSHVLT